MTGQEQQKKIISAVITTDAFRSIEIDVADSIIELVLFENLEKPYVTGQVAILDNNAMFDSMRFSGTERIAISIGSEITSKEVQATRNFIMSSIENVVKANDTGTASVYVFTLIDEHAVLSKSKKISRTVKGSLEEEIQRICAVDLNKEVDISYCHEGGDQEKLVSSTQSNFKAIIPYMHPLEACEWLRDRATTRNGCPFFLYASIHDNRIRLGNLNVMMKLDAFNEKVPYTYSPASVQKAEEQSFTERTSKIQTMRTAKMQNTMNQLMAGAIGSLYNNTNINTGRTTSNHFSLQDLLVELKEDGVIDPDKDQNVYNENFLIGENNLHEYNSKIYHSITSTGTYGYFKSIHDELEPIKFLTKIKNIAIRNMLYKNMFEVTVHGAGFMIAKASVGDIVRINVLSDDINASTTKNNFDSLRSGDFMIYNVRHTFKDTRHDVAMTVCKLVRK
jgi:hypothetical protein